MANVSELLINTVNRMEPKLLIGFDQKWCMTGCPFYIWGHADIESSVNRQGLTHPCDGYGTR